MSDKQKFDIKSMLKVGTTLQMGKYRIERYLSSGGFGNTYVARNTAFDEIVAIKEFFMKGVTQRENNNTTVSVSNSVNQDQFAEQRDKFRKEARRLRVLHSPNIVSVSDLFDENGTVYYVMDYIDGYSLSERVKGGGPMHENEVIPYLHQVLNGLEEVHNKGIWHLDLKPANIMVDRDGRRVRIIDFGASKQLTPEGLATSSALCFTAGYAPREQMEQNMSKFGPWTDLYALGATLYYLLTGKRPPMPSDIEDDHQAALPFPPTVSRPMRDLIYWMMTPSRSKRPQNVNAVRGYLAQMPQLQAAAQQSMMGQQPLRPMQPMQPQQPMQPMQPQQPIQPQQPMQPMPGVAAAGAGFIPPMPQQQAQMQAQQQARIEAERRAREEAERKAREEAERRAHEEAERKAREEAERRAREEAERKAREEAERRAREEAERRAREEAERKAREEAERKAREEAERRAREEAERKAREEAERRAREEAERRAREEAERRAREEAERKAREEAERRAREEAERKAREEAERKAREEAERRAREEAERKAREEAERRAREEAERMAREEAERRAREEAQRKAALEAERKAREEAERQAQEAERLRIAAEQAEQRRLEAERKAQAAASQLAQQQAAKQAQNNMPLTDEKTIIPQQPQQQRGPQQPQQQRGPQSQQQRGPQPQQQRGPQPQQQRGPQQPQQMGAPMQARGDERTVITGPARPGGPQQQPMRQQGGQQPMRQQGGQQPMQQRPATGPAQPQSKGGKKTGLIIGAALVAAALLGAGIFLALNGNSKPDAATEENKTEAVATTTNTDVKKVTDQQCKNDVLGGYKYTGEVDADGKPHGKGKATFVSGPAEGAVYSGPFNHGVFEGENAHYEMGGDTFDGSWKNNGFDKGKYVNNSGKEYFVGTFKNGSAYDGTWYELGTDKKKFDVKNGNQQ